jgi:hypothetical protein
VVQTIAPKGALLVDFREAHLIEKGALRDHL